MSDGFSALRARVADRVVEGEGIAAVELRRAARANAGLAGAARQLIEKVVRRPTDVTDGDLDAVRAEGHSEDAIFELVVCAAWGEAERQLEAALAPLRLLEGAVGDSSS